MVGAEDIRPVVVDQVDSLQQRAEDDFEGRVHPRLGHYLPLEVYVEHWPCK